MQMRSKYNEQLITLNKELIVMGALCEEAIAYVLRALTEGSSEEAARTAPVVREIDQKERSIESMCLKLLLQQQPVASDLRQVSAALKMVTDMKRIGTQAEDIAEIIPFLDGRTREEHIQLGKMAKATIKMVTDSVNAYVNQDIELADEVVGYDDVVDGCFTEVKGNLIGMIAENPSDGGYALDLLMIAKYFERIGDHAVNIAQWVRFSITGKKVYD